MTVLLARGNSKKERVAGGGGAAVERTRKKNAKDMIVEGQSGGTHQDIELSIGLWVPLRAKKNVVFYKGGLKEKAY